jgi:translation elongation factor EF-1alpha
MPAQWEDKNKPHRNIVFVGHVDHGKSTTVGRLLLTPVTSKNTLSRRTKNSPQKQVRPDSDLHMLWTV